MSGACVAVLGGGQLGRMLGLAGIPLDLRFRFLDPAASCPAEALGMTVCGSFEDADALARLARGADVATFEFENVPLAAAEFLAARVPLSPSLRSLATAQDRVVEKEFFRTCGVPVHPFHAINDEADLRDAIDSIGSPAMLKTRRMGYDGKGQSLVHSPAAAIFAWEALGRVPCIYEAHVPFEREVSIVATRTANGAFVAHALTRNEHVDGILRVSVAPDPHSSMTLRSEAERYTRIIAERLGHVGTIAVEFFVSEGALLANEIAPRVHNSGHWTIEGALTSQFENHLRAITGMRLGDPGIRGVAGMVNLIGTLPPLDDLLAVSGGRVHLYGKTPAPGRKLGHVTVTARDHDELEAPLEALRSIVGCGAPVALRA